MADTILCFDPAVVGAVQAWGLKYVAKASDAIIFNIIIVIIFNIIIIINRIMKIGVPCQV